MTTATPPQLGMAWTFTDAVERYEAAVGGLLGGDPARHTIGLTVIENARRRREPLPEPEVFGWWTEPDGTVAGACSLTPPYPLAVEVAPRHSRRALVTALLDGRRDGGQPQRGGPAASARSVDWWPGPTVVGVNAESDLAAELAALWVGATGGRAVLSWVQRLFVLEGLLVPEPLPPGAVRAAVAADRDLAAAWGRGFAEAVGARDPVPLVASVLVRFDQGGMLLWCLDDGTPVSMAARALPAAGAVRIGPVFTPPEHRGRGYAAAVTAAASVEATKVAGTVVLFTDLANPTSNALYPRLGYRPVTDRSVFTFEPT